MPTARRSSRAAAALELLQAGALIHDDVMDGSDTRRGRRPCTAGSRRCTARSGWPGRRRRSASAAAILLGDLCLSWATRCCRLRAAEPRTRCAAKPVFDLMRTELMGGQYLDMLEQARRRRLGRAGAHVIRYKSAKYTVERPLHLGGRAGRRSAPSCIGAYSAYGLPLGEAFQLRDDVLGVFGDPRRPASRPATTCARASAPC